MLSQGIWDWKFWFLCFFNYILRTFLAQILDYRMLYTFTSAKIYHRNLYILFIRIYDSNLNPFNYFIFIFTKWYFWQNFISEDKNIVFLAFLSIVTQKNILLNITYLNESSRRSEIAQFFEFFTIFSQFILLVIFMRGDFNFLINHMFLIIIFCNLYHLSFPAYS